MLNNLTLMGRFTKDPELRYTPSGTAVITFTLAVDRDFTGKDGARQTDFIPCVAWRGTAEFISKHFTKGSLAAVVGEIQSRNFETKDGEKRTVIEMNVENIYFAGERRDAPKVNDAPLEASGTPQNPFESLNDDDGDLPF